MWMSGDELSTGPVKSGSILYPYLMSDKSNLQR